MEALWVGVFGVIGVLSRYSLDKLLPPNDLKFPTSTFLINIAGCVIAAVLFKITATRGMEWRTPLLTGFCGGFTTFSAYALQSIVLANEHGCVWSLAYLLGSALIGAGLVWLIV